MAKRGFLLIIGVVGIFIFAVSCVPTRVAMDYGTSHKLAKFNQILDPQAEKNLDPVLGFDGKAAEAALGKYHKGFQEKSQPPVYSINVSTGGR